MFKHELKILCSRYNIKQIISTDVKITFHIKLYQGNKDKIAVSKRSLEVNRFMKRMLD